ncbi:protein kinase [Streptomyces sp. NPDC056002]|uniref:AbiJ-related protein n=1 Tax=Streptomyces sp. NPDC056002 TaxID=3345675 RepID=UPI0035D6F90A
MSTHRKDLVSPATRTAFRILATNMTVRQVAEAWQSENFAPIPEDELRYTDTSVRRRRFESYAAAVDWSDLAHVTRALRVFEDVLRTGTREGWHGPWLDEVSAWLVQDGLAVDEQGRINGLPVPEPRSAAGERALPTAQGISEVTRRGIFDLLRRQGTDWAGSLDEIAFLARLYDLQSMPSNDGRFSTAERDIIQHRYNNFDWEDDWVYDDARFGLLQGPDETLLRFLAEMLHPAVRMNASEVQQLLTALNEALARDSYALVQVDTTSGYPVYQGRRRNNAVPDPRRQARTSSQAARQPPAAATPAESVRANPQPPAEATALVRQRARGERKDYACDRLPIPHGGQADVFRATHKPTGTIVALKQLRDKHPARRQVARMAREIFVGHHLDGHPHAMPVLDADPNHRWFVMPYAQTTAEHCQQELAEPAVLKGLLDALCSVLADAHEAGWVHRDIKPANILRFEGRWVLADWGIVRRPRGQTTDAQRTRVGVRFGSDGFAAPELSQDAHAATQTADIYSLGQLIGWALTGTMPQINIPLMPRTGPWRTVVRAATQSEPARRPATIEDFQQLIKQETETPPQPAILRGATLQRALEAGSPTAAHELITLVAAHTDDAPLYCDLLVTVPPDSLIPALLATPDQAVEVVRAMAALLGTHRSSERGEVDAAIMWLITIARKAADASELDLLEECCNGAFEWDASWDQWTPQNHIARWLPTLTGDSASSVAAMLRRHPACAAHFRHLTANFHVDHRIRAAIDRAQSEGRNEPLDSLGRPRAGERITTAARKRTILLFDIERFSDRNDVEQAYLRRTLYDIADRILAAAEIDEARRQRADRGDSVMEIIDPSASVLTLLRVLLNELPEQLRAINRTASGSAQLKLRGVLATGRITIDDHNGWVGSDLNHACRLLDAQFLQEALREPDNDFALCVSEAIYEGTVRHGHSGIPPESFERVAFNSKNGQVTAWLTTPA